MGVPQVIWQTALDTGMIKFTEAATCVAQEDFQVLTDFGVPLCMVRVSPPQTSVTWGNMVMSRVTPGVIGDGFRLVSATTRGGVRGPEGMTLAPFACRITVVA